MPVDVLSLHGIDKSFGSNHVLRDVSLSLPAGQVTVLMGANGAGKSTLVKILSGVHARDAGEIMLGSAAFAPKSPLAARAAGVVTVHQGIDDGVIPDLDVAANLMLEELATGHTGLLYRRTALRKRAAEVAERMGLELDLRRPVRELGLADRQMVAIARALSANPQVLILDEPTSSLSAREAERLFRLIDRLREQGVAVLYISHRMSDITRIADRIVAMRDGCIVGVFDEQPLETDAAVEAMLGRVVAAADVDARKGDGIRLTLEGIVLRKGAFPVSLDCAPGEVIAITGLVGSGKSALAETLYGLRQPRAGQMTVDGNRYSPQRPSDAIARGVFLAPKDRASSAVIPDFDLAANLSIPFTRHFSSFGFVQRGRERDSARAMIERLAIVCRSPDDAITKLSGGNQQKVMVGRWLSMPCRVLLLDEPFQGVDIQARRDIGRQLRETAADRVTLVLVSELDEALEVADRIIIMAGHTIVGDHENSGIDLAQVLADVATSDHALVDHADAAHAGSTDRARSAA